MLFLVLLVGVRTVHLQVVVCILFYVSPNTCIHKYPVLILHTVIPAFFGTLDTGHIIQYFFGGNRITASGLWGRSLEFSTADYRKSGTKE